MSLSDIIYCVHSLRDYEDKEEIAIILGVHESLVHYILIGVINP